MEYRRLGRTGLDISAVALGGHWKGSPFGGTGYAPEDFETIRNPDFLRNRRELVARAVDLGINYVDACSPQEILAYSQVIPRDRMLLGWSWHTREPRDPAWRTAARLIDGFGQGLREAGMESAALWRISLPVDGEEDPGEVRRIEDAVLAALDCARQRGMARATGVSSHNRAWLQSIVERHPEQIQVILFPYTAVSRPGPLLDTVARCGCGALGIKPFGGGALFRGDGGDDRRARAAIRRILTAPALTATLPGLTGVPQLENLLSEEPAEAPLALDLPPGRQWLQRWEEA